MAKQTKKKKEEKEETKTLHPFDMILICDANITGIHRANGVPSPHSHPAYTIFVQ